MTLYAKPTICQTLLGSIVVDNVVVPEGAFCILSGTQVRGNVKVLRNGTLQVFSPTTIRGNIESDFGSGVQIFGGGVVIRQNVQIKGAVFNSGYLGGTSIGGNFQYEENSGGFVAIDSFIGGNLKMEKNSGGGLIDGNTIRGNLQCKQNVPPPIGAGNVVGGSKEDQCATF